MLFAAPVVSTSALQTVLGGSSVPDLRDRFIIGSGSSYSAGAQGGSKDATLVSHSHTTNSTSKTLTGAITKISEGFEVNGQATGVFTKTDQGNSSPTESASTSPVSGFDMDVNHRHTTDDPGVAGTNQNLPPYVALAYIIRTS